MNANSAFTGSYTENPFWYQQFDLRQIRILRRGQSIVDFDAADNCRLYVTTMKAMNFQDDISSIPIDNFYVLVFDLTSMQEASENFHYPELVGEPLRLGLNFSFPLKHITEVIVLVGRKNSFEVDKIRVVARISTMDNISFPQTIHRIPVFKYRFLDSFSSYYVPTVSNDFLALLLRNPPICSVKIG